MVAGASRFRWSGLTADEESLTQLLSTFPDADPSRTFNPARCIRIVLRGGRAPVELRRDSLDRKGLLQRQTFWGLLMEVIGAGPLAYEGYSYREHADRFQRPLSVAEADRLRAGCESVKYSTLRDLIRLTAYNAAEAFVVREG